MIFFIVVPHRSNPILLKFDSWKEAIKRMRSDNKWGETRLQWYDEFQTSEDEVCAWLEDDQHSLYEISKPEHIEWVRKKACLNRYFNNELYKKCAELLEFIEDDAERIGDPKVWR